MTIFRANRTFPKDVFFPFLTECHIASHVSLPRGDIWLFGAHFMRPYHLNWGVFPILPPTWCCEKTWCAPQRRLMCTLKGCVTFFKCLPLNHFLTFLLLFETIVIVCEKELKGRRILFCRGSFQSRLSSNLHIFIIFKGMSCLFAFPFTFIGSCG